MEKMTGKIEKKNLTLQDLENAVETINQFASLYRKAQMAVKSLSREQGKYGGMLGRGADPITSMLFGSMEGIVERKLEEMAERKMAMMSSGTRIVNPDEIEHLKEAESGLDETEEKEEEEET